MSVGTTRVSLTEPFRAGWAGLRPQPVLPAPQQISVLATAAAWGPGSPCHCAEGTGDKGLRGQGVRPRLAVNRRLGMGLNDAKLNDPESVGSGLPWRRRGVQPPAVCSTDLLPRLGQLPHRVQVRAWHWGGRGSRASRPNSVPRPAFGAWPSPRHLSNLSLIICQMSPGSTLEGSCEAWQ